MNNRLLTLDDLCDFYSSRKRAVHFKCSDKNDEPIVVQVGGVMSFEKNDESIHEGLLPVTFQACHTDRNANQSSISKEDMEEKFLPTFANRPVLGYIHYIEDVPYFKGHEMHVDPETDEIVYDEVPVGIIPESNNAKLVYDEENEHYNVMIDGYIFEEYSKAAEIIQREGECAVSVEIVIKEMSYAPKDKTLVISDGYFSGITILGVRDDKTPIKPGMVNSNVTLKNFKQSNNSLISNISQEEQSMLVSTLEKLNETLSSLHIEDYRKEEPATMKNFENEVEEVSENQEVEATENEEVQNVETEEVETTVTNESEESETIETTEEESQEAPEVVENESSNESEEATVDENEVSGTESNEVYTRTYELSHDDIRCALYNLLAPYEELDSDFYWISEVYDNRFIYEGWCTDKIYCQGYTKDNDLVAFEGERTELFRELLTASEKAELEEMRSNYSSIQNELSVYKKNELHAQREEIISDEAYAEYLDTAEFKEINSKLDTYSLEELRTECELAYAKAVRGSKKLEFSAKETPKKSTPSFFGFTHVEKESSFLDGLLKATK